MSEIRLPTPGLYLCDVDGDPRAVLSNGESVVWFDSVWLMAQNRRFPAQWMRLRVSNRWMTSEFPHFRRHTGELPDWLPPVPDGGE